MKKQILLLITVLTVSKLTLANCQSDAQCKRITGNPNAYCYRGQLGKNGGYFSLCKSY